MIGCGCQHESPRGRPSSIIGFATPARTPPRTFYAGALRRLGADGGGDHLMLVAAVAHGGRLFVCVGRGFLAGGNDDS